jgi:hypothetical protein
LAPNTSESTEGYVRVYSCFLMAGLVPLLSAFMVAVLAEYGRLLAHIHQDSLLALLVFQHLCEAFVGILPSIA